MIVIWKIEDIISNQNDDMNDGIIRGRIRW